MADIISQNDRLDAVLSKLESVENELRQIKRICQYVRIKSPIMEQVHANATPKTNRDGDESPDGFIETEGDRSGLYPGQYDYQALDRPSIVKQKLEEAKVEEQGTCFT